MKNSKNTLRALSLGLSLTILSCANDKGGGVIDFVNNEKELTMEQRCLLYVCAEDLKEIEKQAEEFSSKFLEMAERDSESWKKDLYSSMDADVRDLALQKALEKALEENNGKFFDFFYFCIFPDLCANYEKDGANTDILDFLLLKQEEIQKVPSFYPVLFGTPRSKPLHWAAEEGSLGVVKYFIETKGVEIDDLDCKHRTPLHYARNFNVAKYLIDEGANVYIFDKDCFTPMDRALFFANKNVIDYILDKGYYLDGEAVALVRAMKDLPYLQFSDVCKRKIKKLKNAYYEMRRNREVIRE